MVFTDVRHPRHGVSPGSRGRPHRPASSQPAWSGTPIPVAWSAVRTIWHAPATVVPLSLFPPEQVAQGAALGSSWKWQADHNVAGGELRSGGVRYLWGFGVHAPNEMVFPLPDSARAFRSEPGDRRGRRRLGLCRGESLPQQSVRHALVPKPAALGLANRHFHRRRRSCAGSSVARRLVLAVEDGGAARGPHADPLDIGDHADWLEPVLLLDPGKLRAAVEKYRAAK